MKLGLFFEKHKIEKKMRIMLKDTPQSWKWDDAEVVAYKIVGCLNTRVDGTFRREQHWYAIVKMKGEYFGIINGVRERLSIVVEGMNGLTIECENHIDEKQHAKLQRALLLQSL